MHTIAVIEDDPRFLATVSAELVDAGYSLQRYTSTEAAEAALASLVRADLLLCDVRMPGRSGVDFIGRHGAALPPVIVLSGEASISETVAALELGVWDFLEKPATRERLLRAVRNCLIHHKLLAEVRADRKGPELIGNAPAMAEMRNLLAKLARSQGRVLITGESGSGKELVADWLHHHGPRASGPFVKINTAALPADLIEDELFGHVRGAFTGALTDKPGLFEQAHAGTLFLDEIGDMDPALQARLLRVLEDGRVRRIGGRDDIGVDVRILAATHRDLEHRCKEGLFREDLFYRLATFPVAVPPLRERGADIPLLAMTFLERFCRRDKTSMKKMEPGVLDALSTYPWPGNVRELRNVCERLAVLAGNPITVSDLPSDLTGSAQPRFETGMVRLPPTSSAISLRDFKYQCEKELIEATLRRFDWDYTACARALEIQRTYLHRKIKKLGILKRPR